MKKFLLSVLLPTILVGCTNSLDETITLDPIEQESGHSAFSQHFVTLDAVAALTEAQMGMTRNSSDIRNRITCYTDTAKDTLLFICDNSEGGWTMYSSDTRVPPIVAQSGTGTFAEAMENENAAWWIKTIAEDMKAIRSAGDNELNFSKEEIESNANFWESVSAPNKFVKEQLGMNETRWKDLPTGHYEFVGSSYHTEIYDSIPRLTVTNWHQDSPFNDYCPYRTDFTTYRSPAGCVAIAGAQMLYFLHEELGVPQTAPSEAYCNGANNTNYDWSQYNYTSGIWDIMNTGSNAAPLIADIGRRVDMNYGNNGSGTYTSRLVNKVFIPYGIDCTYSSYNVEDVKNSLLTGMPVILSAAALDDGETVGHAFITDRYRRIRGVTTNRYEWVYDYIPTNPDGTPILIPNAPHKVETSYSSPTINMIGMNWGWGSDYNNEEEWYSLTGDWICEETYDQLNWNRSRYMIHEFEIIEN